MHILEHAARARARTEWGVWICQKYIENPLLVDDDEAEDPCAASDLAEEDPSADEEHDSPCAAAHATST